MMFWNSKSGIQSRYSYSGSPTFTSEPWAVYTAKPKSSSGNAGSTDKVSVFVFDKKQFENYLIKYGIIKSKSSSKDKLFLHDAYKVLKNQVSNLAKFKHPNILQLIEPLEEHSKSFLFVTEYVSGCLSNLFQEQDSTYGDELLQPNDENKLTIQRGILQVCQALDFIHNTTSSVHLDIQPKSVFINGNADWKLSGFGQLIKLPNGTNVGEYSIPQYDPRVPAFLQIDLNFASPELVLEDTFSPKSDYFSLGLLIYYLYYNKSLLVCENSKQGYKEQYTKFERRIASLSWDAVFQKVPDKLRFCLPRLMNRDIYSRFDNIREFIDNDFFKDPLIKTLIFLDDLPTKSIEEKTIFLQGLVDILPQFPSQLLQKKFLPILLLNLDQLCSMKELNAQCISTNLEVILMIGKSISQLSFHEKIEKHITAEPNFSVLLKDATAIIIQHLSILKLKIKKEVLESTMLKPLYEYVCDNQEIPNLQEALLAQLSIALDVFDFATVKNFLYPLLQKLFTKTTSLTVKNSCVSCFQLLVESNTMDSYMIQESLLPLIKSMKTRDPRILMKFLDFFPVLYSAIKDKEDVVTDHFLPLMLTFSMSNTLSISQFTSYTTSLNNLMRQIQTKHMGTLKTEQSKTEELETTNFTKIIDKPSLPPMKDSDNEISKNINVPVIQPKRVSSQARTTTKTLDQMRASREYQHKQPDLQGQSTLMLHKNVAGHLKQPSRGIPRTSTSTISNFTATTNAPKPQPSQLPTNGFSDFLSSPPSSLPQPAQPAVTSLPPGFGISLQPKKG